MCVCAKSLSRVQLWDPLDCSSPGSSVHGILQARILEWVAISSPRGRDLPDPGIEPASLVSPALQAVLYSLSPWGSLSWKYLEYEFALHVFFKTKGWKWTNSIFLLLKPNSQVGSWLFCVILSKERKCPPEWLPFLDARFSGWPDPRTQGGVSGKGRKGGEEEVEGKK